MKDKINNLLSKYKPRSTELSELSDQIDLLKDVYREKNRELQIEISNEVQQMYDQCTELERIELALTQELGTWNYRIWNKACKNLSSMGFELILPFRTGQFIVSIRMPKTGGYVVKYKDSITKILPALEVKKYSLGEESFDAKVIEIYTERDGQRWLVHNMNTGRFVICDGDEDNGILVAAFGLLDSALQFILEKYGVKVDGRKQKW